MRLNLPSECFLYHVDGIFLRKPPLEEFFFRYSFVYFPYMFEVQSLIQWCKNRAFILWYWSQQVGACNVSRLNVFSVSNTKIQQIHSNCTCVRWYKNWSLLFLVPKPASGAGNVLRLNVFSVSNSRIQQIQSKFTNQYMTSFALQYALR